MWRKVNSLLTESPVRPMLTNVLVLSMHSSSQYEKYGFLRCFYYVRSRLQYQNQQTEKQTHKCYSNYSIMRSYFRCFTTITRLISHSIYPSRINQSIDRNRSITRWSKERTLNRSISRSVLIDHSNFRSVNHSINQLIDHRSISLSIDLEIDRDRDINRPTNRSSKQSIKAYYVL